jgi:hypothetical protein
MNCWTDEMTVELLMKAQWTRFAPIMNISVDDKQQLSDINIVHSWLQYVVFTKKALQISSKYAIRTEIYSVGKLNL